MKNLIQNAKHEIRHAEHSGHISFEYIQVLAQMVKSNGNEDENKINID